MEFSFGHNFAVIGPNWTFYISLESALQNASNGVQNVFYNFLYQKLEFDWWKNVENDKDGGTKRGVRST